ncbi:MAG: hypothetical protein H0W36_04145 [Gemmatimonadetes bacterium]|nr:hypothetical protein [Gemmatimonadota bacterium]
MRRVVALAKGLPPDSAVARAETEGWTFADEIAAATVETVDMWGRVLAVTLGAKPQKLPGPPQITHPGRKAFQPEDTSKKTTRDLADLAAFIARN